MRINNTQNISKNGINTDKSANFKGGREIIRTLANPDSLAATIVLESFVTGGRSYNGYKRGGKAELRECFTDNFISAVFWMKGVDIFNKIGDFIGSKFLKLPTTEFDAGKDALRTPLKNLVNDLKGQMSNPSAVNAMEKKLAIFKFSKIIISAILSTGFIGFALPKINQAITRRMMGNKKPETQDKPSNNVYNPLQDFTFEQFEKQIAKKHEASPSPTFKGVSSELIAGIAHNLEHQPIVKMLTNDFGILSGRVITARNPDEGAEYLFRDVASSFFYFASTPLMYKLLQKVSGKVDLTNLDPVAAKQVTERMLEQLKNADGSFTSMSAEQFAKNTIGVMSDKAKELISRLPFNSDVISLAELRNHIGDENIIAKAIEMAKLQPEQAGVGAVLTRQQVADVLKEGSINSPEFMQKIYRSRFGEALTNPYKFISMKKINKFRDNVEQYAQHVIETAQSKNGGVVDKKLLDRINRNNFISSSAFRLAAIAFSGVALGIIIPKLQHKLTEMRTGSKAAPGLREFQQEDKKVSQ